MGLYRCCQWTRSWSICWQASNHSMMWVPQYAGSLAVLYSLPFLQNQVNGGMCSQSYSSSSHASCAGYKLNFCWIFIVVLLHVFNVLYASNILTLCFFCSPFLTGDFCYDSLTMNSRLRKVLLNSPTNWCTVASRWVELFIVLQYVEEDTQQLQTFTHCELCNQYTTTALRHKKYSFKFDSRSAFSNHKLDRDTGCLQECILVTRSVSSHTRQNDGLRIRYFCPMAQYASYALNLLSSSLVPVNTYVLDESFVAHHF